MLLLLFVSRNGTNLFDVIKIKYEKTRKMLWEMRGEKSWAIPNDNDENSMSWRMAQILKLIDYMGKIESLLFLRRASVLCFTSWVLCVDCVFANWNVLWLFNFECFFPLLFVSRHINSDSDKQICFCFLQEWSQPREILHCSIFGSAPKNKVPYSHRTIITNGK